MTDAERIAVLQEFVTPRRLERMRGVLSMRTRAVAVVIEDIYQPHNASAVLRSCESFGVQDVHIVENRNRYRINPEVELGTAQWLTLHRYNEPITADDPQRNTRACIDRLRTAGYRIVATTPHHNDCTLDRFDLTRGRAAFLFGTEKEGLSATALAAADEFVRIPMVGFVESLNISVCAAVTLWELTTRLRRECTDWPLRSDESQAVLLSWLRSSVKHAALIETRSQAPQARSAEPE